MKLNGQNVSTSCSKDAEMHLLLYYSGLVSMQCIEEVSGSVWMQTNPEFVFSCMFQSLGKQIHLVPIHNCP